ncbi:MAG: hypothetical protein EOO46_22510 [Flavobacterium sp.]|nr:MAG: hypothetical protein EOO46_22510 [Flavobacterium sp.]
MKEDSKKNQKKKVKEISEGVYINSTPIPSDSDEFEKAIEESFKELKDTDAPQMDESEDFHADLNQSKEI